MGGIVPVGCCFGIVRAGELLHHAVGRGASMPRVGGWHVYPSPLVGSSSSATICTSGSYRTHLDGGVCVGANHTCGGVRTDATGIAATRRPRGGDGGPTTAGKRRSRERAGDPRPAVEHRRHHGGRDDGFQRRNLLVRGGNGELGVVQPALGTEQAADRGRTRGGGFAG